MSNLSRFLAPILLLTLLGTGCLDRPYVPGDVPTDAQLERMTPEEMEAGMRAMLEREPASEFSESEMREARNDAIATTRDGSPDRFADFTPALLHQATGNVRIVRNGDKLSVVFSEDFSVTPGPRLVVRVSGREIGALQSTKGAQTYDVPDGIDLSSIDEVDIYCKPFHFVFARAQFGN